MGCRVVVSEHGWKRVGRRLTLHPTESGLGRFCFVSSMHMACIWVPLGHMRGIAGWCGLTGGRLDISWYTPAGWNERTPYIDPTFPISCEDLNHYYAFFEE